MKPFTTTPSFCLARSRSVIGRQTSPGAATAVLSASLAARGRVALSPPARHCVTLWTATEAAAGRSSSSWSAERWGWWWCWCGLVAQPRGDRSLAERIKRRRCDSLHTYHIFLAVDRTNYGAYGTSCRPSVCLSSVCYACIVAKR